LGSSLSDRQADLLHEHFRSAVLMLDGDPAGWSATEAITRRLAPIMKVAAIPMSPGVQPDQLAPKEINSLLSGHVRPPSRAWER
jgi:DNA primase